MWKNTPAGAFVLVVALSATFWWSGTVRAQNDVEAWYDRLFAAYNTADVEWIAEHDILSVAGFGFRAAAWRDPLSADDDAYGLQNLRAFFDQMEYYRIEPEALDFRDDGDVVVAWGIWVEDFRIQGQPAERARVRFTNVFRRTPEGLRQLLYHRDIQPFSDQGRYLQETTRTPN